MVRRSCGWARGALPPRGRSTTKPSRSARSIDMPTVHSSEDLHCDNSDRSCSLSAIFSAFVAAANACWTSPRAEWRDGGPAFEYVAGSRNSKGLSTWATSHQKPKTRPRSRKPRSKTKRRATHRKRLAPSTLPRKSRSNAAPESSRNPDLLDPTAVALVVARSRGRGSTAVTAQIRGRDEGRSRASRLVGSGWCDAPFPARTWIDPFHGR